MSLDLSDVRRTPYQLGGRKPGVGLDCLGVVLAIAERLGLPVPDPWKSIEAAWIAGDLKTATGFPAGWCGTAAADGYRTGDVMLFYGPRHPWAAIVCDGYVWSADESLGCVYSRPVSRWTRIPNEVWRHDPPAYS